ncbi:MAG: hypothetical protein KDD47_27240 [Acidobacteria bacterium]|nr:hypothetical protein [Acidobacteriota bacterium]
MPQLIGGLLLLCLVIAVVYLIVRYVLPALIVAGAVYGAAVALFNYFQALGQNVRPERVSS